MKPLPDKVVAALAIAERTEGCETVALSLADLTKTCAHLDGEVLGEYVERNWDLAVGNALGLMFLVKEMKRRFGLLDRKKRVDGTYRTIRGFTSFDKWFTSFTGKSRRLAYYLLETEEQKHKRNAERRTSEKKKDTDSTAFLSRCGDTKKTLAEIQRKLNFHTQQTPVDVKPLYAQIDPTINAVFQEFLTLIAPDGYEVRQGDRGWWMTKKHEDDEPEPPTPEEKKAQRSAAAKKTAKTRAANKAAQSKPPSAAPPALGECEWCGDAPATERIEKRFGGGNFCAKCAALDRKSDRKYLIRQMGVQRVMGKFCTLKNLVELSGKTMDMGGGETYTYPTMQNYVARVREEFLGKARHDQAVVVEHIARLEKKTEPAKALAAAGGGCPEDEAL